MENDHINLPEAPTQTELQHTKVLGAAIGGKVVKRGPRGQMGWTAVCKAVVDKVYQATGKNIEATRACLRMKAWELSPGGRDGEEWTLAPHNAMASTRLLANAVEKASRVVPNIEVHLMWRDKPGAAHPGREGIWGAGIRRKQRQGG